MGRLYRIVPDTISTVLTTGYLSNITEDIFYKLGYMSSPNGSYFGIYERGVGMTWESASNSMFFFTSPWSCVRALKYLRDDYSNKVARILEYEIPDNVVNSSRDVFTNYTNWQAKGKMIPFSLLSRDCVVYTDFCDELKEKMQEVALDDTDESIRMLCGTYSKYEMDLVSKHLASANRMERINNRRFEKSGSYFASDMITGKTMMVTGVDCDVMFDVMANKASEDDLCEIMKRSNGILTPDNFVDYDFDEANHRYGPILV